MYAELLEMKDIDQWSTSQDNILDDGLPSDLETGWVAVGGSRRISLNDEDNDALVYRACSDRKALPCRDLPDQWNSRDRFVITSFQRLSHLLIISGIQSQILHFDRGSKAKPSYRLSRHRYRHQRYLIAYWM
jgi:hypothetical protein